MENNILLPIRRVETFNVISRWCTNILSTTRAIYQCPRVVATRIGLKYTFYKRWKLSDEERRSCCRRVLCCWRDLLCTYRWCPCPSRFGEVCKGNMLVDTSTVYLQLHNRQCPDRGMLLASFQAAFGLPENMPCVRTMFGLTLFALSNCIRLARSSETWVKNESLTPQHR